MRFLFRWAFRLFLVVVVIAVALVLVKDALGKAWAESQIRAQTGMDTRIGKLELGLLSPTITIEDLKVFNRAEFGGSPFVDVPDLHLEYSPGAMALGKLRFKLVRLSVAEVNVVEGRDGRTNLAVSVDGISQWTGPSQSDRRLILGLQFAGVDTLNLSVGKVIYTSLRHSAKATEVNVNLKNEVLTNVRTLSELTDVVMRAMVRNGITISSESSERPRTRVADRQPAASTGGKASRRSTPVGPR